LRYISWLRALLVRETMEHAVAKFLQRKKNGSQWLPFSGIFPSRKSTPVGRLIQGTNWPVSGLFWDGAQ